MSNRARSLKPQPVASDATAVPVHDADWMAPLLDTTRVAGLLRDRARPGAPPILGCRRRHVRYRPGAGCTVLYDVMTEQNPAADPLSIYVRRLAPGRGAPPPSTAPAGAAERRQGTILAGPLAVDAGQTVFREYPDDRILTDLAVLEDPRELAREIVAGLRRHEDRLPLDADGTFTRVRYKPETRSVYRCDLTWRDGDGSDRSLVCQLRFERKVQARPGRELIADLQMRLPDGSDLALPASLPVIARARYALLEWLEGDDLARRLRGEDGPTVAHAMGRALAALQSLAVERLELVGAVDVVARIGVQVAAIHRAPPAPDLVPQFAAMLARLERAAADMPVQMPRLVHGDFHQGQMLSMGNRVCVLDWDRAHRGDPAEDHGRFLAQLDLLDLRGKTASEPLVRAFQAGHAAAGGDIPTSRSLRFWHGLALLDLALREIRRLQLGWPERIAALLVRGEERLAGKGTP